MPRIPLNLPALVFLLAVGGPAAVAQPIDFGTVELGEVRTSCFTICFGQGCSGSGTVHSITVNAPFFARGIRTASGVSDLCNTPNVSTPRSLPIELGPDERVAVDVDVVPTETGDFQRPLSINGSPLLDFEAFVAPVSGCSPSSNALCLNDDRFKVRVHWRTVFGTRGAGPAVQVAPVPDDSGLFYFFTENNWEMLVKVLDACAPPFEHFWVFAAATTNVEFTLTVVDTEAQEANAYFHPQGPPAPALTDTAAFATCP